MLTGPFTRILHFVWLFSCFFRVGYFFRFRKFADPIWWIRHAGLQRIWGPILHKFVELLPFESAGRARVGTQVLIT